MRKITSSKRGRWKGKLKDQNLPEKSGWSVSGTEKKHKKNAKRCRGHHRLGKLRKT